jgi:hypothetical protein
MVGNSVFEFASPGVYGDWANYAGFNRRTGEIEGMSSQAGVPPPENLQAYMNQRLGAAQNKLSAVAPAMQQLTQGNITKAAGMIRNPSPQGSVVPGSPALPALPALTPSPVNNDYDYTHGIENSGLNLPSFPMPTYG